MSSSSSNGSQPTELVYRAARERITTPAVFLLITGLLNLVLGGMLVFAQLRVASLNVKERQALVIDFWVQLSDSQRQRLRDLPVASESEEVATEVGHVLLLAGRDTELGDQVAGGIDKLALPLLANGAVGILIAILATFVSIQMFRLRAHRVCVIASIIAMLLIVAPTTVFLIGYLFGLWDTSTQVAYLLPTCCGGLGAFINGPSIVWCFSVLRSPEVREAFDRRAETGATA